MNSKTASSILSSIGSILLLIGVIAAFYGPLEIYCYYLFTDGGKFHYEGFGFGTFMFGSITLQIMGYYIIALIFIPLGYGHLKKQSWIQKISLTLLWSWLIVGIPLLLILLSIFFNTKKPTIFVVIPSVVLMVISYAVLPMLLIEFYRNKGVAVALKLNENTFNFIRKYPIPILLVILLYVFYIITFHILLLYRGIFPFFGKWLINLPGFLVITTSILIIIGLLIGTLQLKKWAWWLSIFYFISFAVSTVITLLLSDFSDILNLLQLPAKEMNALKNIPLKGIHLCGIFGLPVVVSVGVILFSNKYFVVVKKTG